MVAVKNHEADQFLARQHSDIYLYLFFGSDGGLVSERARRFIAGAIDDPKDPYQRVRLKGDELAADPSRLADEVNTVSLFSGKRTISIEAQGKAFTTAVERVLSVSSPPDCKIVIEAGVLIKDAALRVLCERSRHAAAIQCYADTAKDLGDLINGLLAQSGQRITPDAKAFLISQLGEDRLITRGELEKLLLYSHGQYEIRLEDAEAIASDTSSLLAEKAVDAAFDGEFAALDHALRQFSRASGYHLLLATALRHTIEMHFLCGESSLASPAAKTPGYTNTSFVRRASLDRQIHHWTRVRLSHAMSRIGDAIAISRREPKLGQALASRALWAIAKLARG